MASPRDITLLPDAGPLITLAYAEALDLLLKPGWTVALVDMVLHEVTRSRTPNSGKVASWAAAAQVPVISTRTFRHFQQATIENPSTRTRNLGELAIQETMNDLALRVPPTTAVFLFEDHRIARASFLLPENCRKVSTRAFLAFLAQRGWIESAADIERRALQAGRAFSTLRFPP